MKNRLGEYWRRVDGPIGAMLVVIGACCATYGAKDAMTQSTIQRLSEDVRDARNDERARSADQISDLASRSLRNDQRVDQQGKMLAELTRQNGRLVDMMERARKERGEQFQQVGQQVAAANRAANQAAEQAARLDRKLDKATLPVAIVPTQQQPVRGR